MAVVFKHLAGLLGLIALLGAPLPASAAGPPPLTAYGQLPAFEQAALSPSGEKIAAVATFRGERALVFFDSALNVKRSAPVGDVKVRGLDWVGEDAVLLMTSETEDLGHGFTADQYEAYRALIVPEDAGKPPRVVFAGNSNIVSSIFGSYGIRQVEGEWVGHFGGVTLSRDNTLNSYLAHARPALFAVRMSDNSPRRIANPADEDEWRDWLVDARGGVAVTFDMDRRTGEWRMEGPGGKAIARGRHATGAAGLVSLGRDGTSVVYYAEDAAEETTRWFEVPLDGSAAPTEMLADEEIERLYVDRTTGRMLGYLRGGADAGPVFFDPQHQGLANQVHRAFAGKDLTLVDWTPDLSHVIVHTSGSGDSGTWYIVDLAKLRAEAFGLERPAIPAEQVGPISTFAYAAADGLEMDGILTLPPGREPAGLPVVVLPHGGPTGQDNAAFDWWAQAFASRGYAVFQPNFRGSTNRDEAFERAGHGEWGRKMQTDISDGLAALAAKGIVDPARACIVGGSYGGYAALAGVTLQQGLYRCAVAVAPVADLALMYRTDVRESGDSRVVSRSLREQLGPPSGYDAVSPRRFAARADAPILLIHGKDDTVVPFAQSDSMADALKDAGKPYKLVVLREEDHWLSRASTRLQMLEEAVAFVEEHNPAS
ncbi:MAG TPA: S9 family peptidase [Croceibacterium sp.]|nr:S9 family peptidase [Croceibacterium sp.]